MKDWEKLREQLQSKLGNAYDVQHDIHVRDKDWGPSGIHSRGLEGSVEFADEHNLMTYIRRYGNDLYLRIY